MTLLILGVALWWGAHLVKALAPGLRAGIADRLGAGPSRGLFAALIALSVVLMVVGFRAAPVVELWASPPWTRHVNNLLMAIAVLAFATSHSKSRARAWFRHRPGLQPEVVLADVGRRAGCQHPAAAAGGKFDHGAVPSAPGARLTSKKSRIAFQPCAPVSRKDSAACLLPG